MVSVTAERLRCTWWVTASYCRRCWEWYLIGVRVGDFSREPTFHCPRCDLGLVPR